MTTNVLVSITEVQMHRRVCTRGSSQDASIKLTTDMGHIQKCQSKKLDLSKRWNWVELCSPESRRGRRLLWIQLKKSHISASGCARAAANHPAVEQSEGKVHRPCALCKSNGGGCQQCSGQCQSTNCVCVCIAMCVSVINVFFYDLKYPFIILWM